MSYPFPTFSGILVTFLSISMVLTVEPALNDGYGSADSLKSNWKPYKLKLSRRKLLDTPSDPSKNSQYQIEPQPVLISTNDPIQTNTFPSTMIGQVSQSQDQSKWPAYSGKHSNSNNIASGKPFNGTSWNQTSTPSHLGDFQSLMVENSGTSGKLYKRRLSFDGPTHSSSKSLASRRESKRTLNWVVTSNAVLEPDGNKRGLGETAKLQERSQGSTRNLFEPRQDPDGLNAWTSNWQLGNGAVEDFDGLFGDMVGGSRMDAGQDWGAQSDPAAVGLDRRNSNSKLVTSRHNNVDHSTDKTPSGSNTGDGQQLIKSPEILVTHGGTLASQSGGDPTNLANSSDDLNNEINRINSQTFPVYSDPTNGSGASNYPTAPSSGTSDNSTTSGSSSGQQKHHKSHQPKKSNLGLNGGNNLTLQNSQIGSSIPPDSGVQSSINGANTNNNSDGFKPNSNFQVSGTNSGSALDSNLGTGGAAPQNQFYPSSGDDPGFTSGNVDLSEAPETANSGN